MAILDDNLAKIKELMPDVQYAGIAWCTQCFNLNLQFRILEVFRTQERQQALYQQGRSKPGPIVTWTLQSMHTQRLAVDIEPLNCSHADIVEIAARYGITHPLAFDPPHYEFDKVPPAPQQEINPLVRLKGLQRRLPNEKDPGLIAIIKMQIKRLTERLKDRNML